MELGLKGNLGALIICGIDRTGRAGGFVYFDLLPVLQNDSEGVGRGGIYRWGRCIQNVLENRYPYGGATFIIVGVYAFSLYWNETFLTSFYLDGKIRTVPMLLGDLQNTYGAAVKASQSGDFNQNPNLNFTEAKAFAGTLLSIIPLVTLYLIVQRWFVESIDKTGITGE